MSTVSILRWMRLAALGLLLAGPAWSQVPVDEAGNPLEAEVLDEGAELAAAAEDHLSLEELEALVGRIALYPDDLLAIVLPASAYPLQIVQAARFLDELEDDPGLEPDESWDDSVVALLNYPEVLRMMNEDLEWTYALGEAVVSQQPDVIAAIEAFRDKAYAAGNLKSDDRQTVKRENGVIQIQPVEEDVIYVPYYEPERVIVYQPEPVYHYYARPYPVYYYPYPQGYVFPTRWFWGVTTAFHIGWFTDHLHVWHHSYHGHPYFGRPYYFTHWWYRRPSIHVHNTYYVNNHVRRPPHYQRDGDFWRPRRHGGGVLERRAYREAYYTDRARSEAGYRRDLERRTRGDATARRPAANRDSDLATRFTTRNRAGAAAREREARGSVGERSAATRQRDDAARVRPAERARDEGAVRFRAREQGAVPERRQPAAVPERRVERSAPALRERPAIRRDADSVRRAPPAGGADRSAPRSFSSPGTSSARPAPGVSRPAPSVARPAPSASRPAPSVSRPAPSVSRPSSGVSRSSSGVSRPSSGVSRSSSVSRPASAAPRSSAPRRSHRD